MAALYRDYRPKDFSEVISQEHIKTTLRNAVASGSFAHAYLFTGMRGTGKTSVARILARAVNCEKQKDGEPCNKCSSCKAFLDGTSLDLVEIDAASNTGVENIREIIEHLKFSPTSAKYKVFIIDEVHMLSKGAFNALLKTLEEPPAHAIFILATTEIHKVPATVISRTQRFDFKRIDNAALLKHLKEIVKKEKLEVDDQSLQLIVNASEGSVRDALSILDKLASFGKANLQQTETLLGLTNVISAQKFLDLLAAKDAQNALNFLQDFFSSGVDPVQFNKDFLEYLRKVLLASMGANLEFALDENQKKNLTRQAKEIKPNQLLYVIRLFLRANKDFQTSPNAELPLEIAAAEGCLAPGAAQAPSSTVAGETGAASTQRPTQQSAHLQPSENQVKKNAEKVVTQAAEPQNVSGPLIAKEQLDAAWPELMSKLRENASTLFAIMKTTQIRSVENNNITFVCAYKFHKDSLENPRNRAALLNVLSEYFKTEFSLSVLVEKEEKDVSDAASAALEVFGGELV